ncbi:MAG: hypothetical protein KAI50_14375, partial [Desulfobacterales bacterium]|nr:hypothetical protein [Desulfobacterales bacterium]
PLSFYFYNKLGTSHEIHSSESINIKPSGGTIPLEAFSDSYPCSQNVYFKFNKKLKKCTVVKILIKLNNKEEKS